MIFYFNLNIQSVSGMDEDISIHVPAVMAQSRFFFKFFSISKILVYSIYF
jgi:hypothetical protein